MEYFFIGDPSLYIIVQYLTYKLGSPIKKNIYAFKFNLIMYYDLNIIINIYKYVNVKNPD